MFYVKFSNEWRARYSVVRVWICDRGINNLYFTGNDNIWCFNDTDTENHCPLTI